MRQLRVKPESFKYFHNFEIYYLDGFVTEPIVEENTLLLQKGSQIQLVFNSQTLGLVDLTDSNEFIFTVDPIVREGFVRGKQVLRFTATRINEDDKWRSDRK